MVQMKEQDMLKAFSNAGTMGSFVTAQLETLQASREYDDFIHRGDFGEVSGHRVLIKRGPGNRGPTECGTTHEAIKP